MKNNFQSKTYPQGSRTLWRYLSALILLFSLGIGQMWAVDPDISSYDWEKEVVAKSDVAKILPDVRNDYNTDGAVFMPLRFFSLSCYFLRKIKQRSLPFSFAFGYDIA